MADCSSEIELILASVWYCLNQAQGTTVCCDNIYDLIDKEQNSGRLGTKNGNESEKESFEGETFNETVTDTQSFKEKDTNIEGKDTSVAGLSALSYICTSQNTNAGKSVYSSTQDMLNTKTDGNQYISNDIIDPKEDNSLSVEARSDHVKILERNIKLNRNSNTISEETSRHANNYFTNNESDLNVMEFKHKDQSPYVQKNQTSIVSELDIRLNNNINCVKDIISEVEIITVDDDISNDSEKLYDEPNTNKEENLSDKREERREEKEPDYFDMDCDEIDDDFGDEEEYEDVTNDENTIAAESDINTNTIQKDADITIISDDEDECEITLKNESLVSTNQSSKKIFYKSYLNRRKEHILGNEKLSKSVNTKSKRKQSLTNIKEDFPLISIEKILSKSQEEKGLNEQNSQNLFCPVMEHLDNMSVATLSKETEKKLSFPIISEAIITTDNFSTKHHSPTFISTQSVYVSSDMVHGSISSLPTIQILQDEPFDPDTLSQSLPSTSNTNKLDKPRPQTHSSVLCQHQSSTSKLSNKLGSPKRKKRLLDHDKKWHMEPKFSQEQDKYLALPGGMESNSVLNDWKQAGSYSSKVSYVPSIGIEKVDSDYMNSQSICDENYFVDVEDEAVDNKDKNRVSEYEGNGRKRKIDSNLGTKRSGRPILDRSESNIPSRMLERDKGPLSKKRVRPSLRNARVHHQDNFVPRSKPDKKYVDLRKDVSPSKFSSLRRDSRGRKIGFYSIKVGKPKNTKDLNETKCAIKGVTRGRGRPRKQHLLSSIIKSVGRPRKHPVKNNTSKSLGRPRKHSIQNNTKKIEGRGKTSKKSCSLTKKGKKEMEHGRQRENQDNDVVVVID